MITLRDIYPEKEATPPYITVGVVLRKISENTYYILAQVDTRRITLVSLDNSANRHTEAYPLDTIRVYSPLHIEQVKAIIGNSKMHDWEYVGMAKDVIGLPVGGVFRD